MGEARGTAPRSTRLGDGTRETIIREARALFRERGFDGTVMSELARRSGVTSAALYWHFASKADLCAEILGRDYRDFLAELTERAVGDTPEQQLHAYAEAFIELQLSEVEVDPNFSYVQLRQELSDKARKEIQKLERAMLDLLRDILRAGQSAGDFEVDDVTVTALVILAMLEYVFVWFDPHGRLSAAEVATLQANLAVKMVRAA